MKTIDWFRKIKNQILNPIHEIRAKDATDDLDKLGKIFGTDKIGTHHFTPHYKLHFDRFRDKKINLLFRKKELKFSREARLIKTSFIKFVMRQDQ